MCSVVDCCVFHSPVVCVENGSQKKTSEEEKTEEKDAGTKEGGAVQASGKGGGAKGERKRKGKDKSEKTEGRVVYDRVSSPPPPPPHTHTHTHTHTLTHPSHAHTHTQSKPHSKSKSSKQQAPVSLDPAEQTSEFANSTNIGSIVIILLMMFLVLFAVHCTWVTSNAYSSPSVVLASTNQDGYVGYIVTSVSCSLLNEFILFRSRNILDDFREAYFWLRQNTHDQATVMSWWDYGYQIAGVCVWGGGGGG